MMDTYPDPAAWAERDTDAGTRPAIPIPERRVKRLEMTISDFCKFVVDSGSQIGMSRDFHRNFADLCEVVGFDADEYDKQGFDREDV